MPLYKYRAVSASGDILDGEMEAPSTASVAERLVELGHTPVRAEEAGSDSASSSTHRNSFACSAASAGAISAC